MGMAPPEGGLASDSLTSLLGPAKGMSPGDLNRPLTLVCTHPLTWRVCLPWTPTQGGFEWLMTSSQLPEHFRGPGEMTPQPPVEGGS